MDRILILSLLSIFDFATISFAEDGSGWFVVESAPAFASETIRLPAKQSGIIEKIDVKVHQEVRAKDAIASLEKSAALLEENVAALQLQFANALVKDDHDVQFGMLVVEEARLALEAYEQINQRGSANEAEMRTKRLGVSQAELKLGHAVQNVEQAKVKSRLAQATFLSSKQKVDSLDIVSPIEATVFTIHKHAGEWVQSGETVVTIVKLDKLHVDCFLPRKQLPISSMIGTVAKVEFETFEGQKEFLVGKVERIEPSVAATGEVRASIAVENRKVNGGWILLPGMTVGLKIQIPTSSQTTSILKKTDSNERSATFLPIDKATR